jgi:hypothetical protein
MEEMRVLRDVAIPVDDGNILRADIFCPTSEKPAPVIMTLGPYGKGVRWKDGWAPQWKWMMQAHPNILAGSTREHMAWETVDPELWVKWGYVCIRVDSRGAGRSPGRLDIFSPRETKDYYDAIEWAAIQPWCSGRVGLCGISYYAITQVRIIGAIPFFVTAHLGSNYSLPPGESQYFWEIMCKLEPRTQYLTHLLEIAMANIEMLVVARRIITATSFVRHDSLGRRGRLLP